MFELREKDLFQAAEAVDMQRLFPSEEMHGKKKASETEIVISVQVTDEDVVYLVQAHIVLAELQLASLAAVYQELVVMDEEHLRGCKATVGGKRSA
jgi:hypothetical protein